MGNLINLGDNFARSVVKNAPIGTVIVALSALVVATWSLLAQKGVARRRAAIDFFLKTEMDEKLLTAYDNYKSGIDALRKVTDDLEAFCKTDDYRHVRNYLNVFELMAVGIENSTFDERICYVYWKGFVLDTMRETSKLIDHIRTRDNADLYFRSFRQLHYRWMTNPSLLSVGSTEADHYGAGLYLSLPRHRSIPMGPGQKQQAIAVATPAFRLPCRPVWHKFPWRDYRARSPADAAAGADLTADGGNHWLGSPDQKSENHLAPYQLGFAAQATGVAFHGRTKSPSGSSDFDTSEKREGKGGAADQASIHCLPLVADTAVVRAWSFPLPTFERARGLPVREAPIGHQWTSILSRCRA